MFDNLNGMTVQEWREGETCKPGDVRAKADRLWRCKKEHKTSKNDYAVDYHGIFARWVVDYWEPYAI